MKLSRTVSYALQATLLLAQEGTAAPVPCSRLAAMGKMPERFLLQILRDLVAHGILASARGVEGGYMLERSADRISLLDVIEAVNGPMASTLPCCDGLSAQSRSRLVKALSGATNSTRRELAGVKLADLLPQTGKAR